MGCPGQSSVSKSTTFPDFDSHESGLCIDTGASRSWILCLFREHFLHIPGVGKCPNWTSPNYWGYNLQRIFEGDVQNPQKGTFTNPCIPLDSLVGRTSNPFILDINFSQGALRGGALCPRHTWNLLPGNNCFEIVNIQQVTLSLKQIWKKRHFAEKRFMDKSQW